MLVIVISHVVGDVDLVELKWCSQLRQLSANQKNAAPLHSIATNILWSLNWSWCSRPSQKLYYILMCIDIHSWKVLLSAAVNPHAVSINSLSDSSPPSSTQDSSELTIGTFPFVCSSAPALRGTNDGWCQKGVV